MRVSLGSKAEEDLKEIDKGIRKKITLEIEELSQDPLPDNSYVIQLPDGTEIQCPKIQEQDRNSKLNHRITYDIKGDEVRIYGIFQHGNKDTRI